MSRGSAGWQMVCEMPLSRSVVPATLPLHSHAEMGLDYKAVVSMPAATSVSSISEGHGTTKSSVADTTISSTTGDVADVALLVNGEYLTRGKRDLARAIPVLLLLVPGSLSDVFTWPSTDLRRRVTMRRAKMTNSADASARAAAIGSALRFVLSKRPPPPVGVRLSRGVDGVGYVHEGASEIGVRVGK